MKIIKLLAVFSFIAVQAVAQEQFDYFFKSATVYDGTHQKGSPRHVGVKGDRIVYVGTDSTLQAKEIIDARGYVLAPGFIDPHTHADRLLKVDSTKYLYPWIAQGVTTVLTGSDGFGDYKVKNEFSKYVNSGMGANVGVFVGFGSIRAAVLGREIVSPTDSQIEKMKTLVDQGMREGALGFSTGLIYVPQLWSETPEIIALAKVAAQYGGIYDTHMRAEGTEALKSIEEVVRIGKEANIPVHISHIKITDQKNWGRSVEMIALIEKHRAEGMDITANQYPFIASMTGLRNGLIPSWAMAGNNADMVKRFSDPKDGPKIREYLDKITEDRYRRMVVSSLDKKIRHLNNKSIYDLSQMWNLSCSEATIRLLTMSPSVSGLRFTMSEEDILNFSRQPWVMTGSDGGGLHPRTYSTFTQIIENHCLAKDIFPLEWAIHRSTGMTAEKFKLKERGFIREGYYADIILFKPNEVRSNSDFSNIDRLSEGMEYVLINGIPVIKNKKFTNMLPGVAIKRPDSL